MNIIRSVFRFLSLGALTLLGMVGCMTAPNSNSYAATPTIPTFTLAPPTETANLSIVWSATPDPDATVNFLLSSLPPESYAATSTPGWLTPPSATFTASNTLTATILFDTPKPGEIQGVRGTVTASPGAVEAGELVPTPSPVSGVRVMVLDPITGQVVAETRSGSYGLYEIQLGPGRYTLCAVTDFRDLCIPDIIVRAGIFTSVDLGYGME